MYSVMSDFEFEKLKSIVCFIDKKLGIKMRVLPVLIPFIFKYC